jgi:hypothetical protein
MTESREARVKRRLHDICDRMYSEKRSRELKEGIVYWVLRHPNLYIYGDGLDFYLVDDEGQKLPTWSLVEYINYEARRDRSSVNPAFEKIKAEIVKQKNKHFS